MANEPHVLLLGNSIFMDSLAGSLQMRKTPKVTQVNTDSFDIKDIVNSINPDVIVYELGAQIAHSPFSIGSEHAEILQLAIDLAGRQAFWVQYKREPTESMQELCDFISREANLMLQTRSNYVDEKSKIRRIRSSA